LDACRGRLRHATNPAIPAAAVSPLFGCPKGAYPASRRLERASEARVRVPGSVVVAYDHVDPALERRRLVASRSAAPPATTEPRGDLVESAA
jgi:hypothetical protein